MAKIIVYNNDTNRMEVYYRGENENMPYNTGTMKVKEFRGSSRANTLWTDKRTMQAWNSFRYLYGRPVYIGFAFKRTYEGGHGLQSQHYAGTAFDVGQTATNAERARIRSTAVNSGVWSYVEPASLTPTWVHFDRRFGTPACATGGYPLIRRGSRGNYVLIAQDGLNTLGYKTGGLDGIFGEQTYNATRQYQRKVRTCRRWYYWLQYMEIIARICNRYWKNRYNNRLENLKIDNNYSPQLEVVDAILQQTKED